MTGVYFVLGIIVMIIIRNIKYIVTTHQVTTNDTWYV